MSFTKQTAPIGILALVMPGLWSACVTSAGAAEESIAGDAAGGRGKSTLCAGCHGPAGIATNPRYPNLAGQHEAYLIKTLIDYRDGARPDPEMAPMAQNLTDGDIRDLAAFYAGQNSP